MNIITQTIFDTIKQEKEEHSFLVVVIEALDSMLKSSEKETSQNLQNELEQIKLFLKNEKIQEFISLLKQLNSEQINPETLNELEEKIFNVFSSPETNEDKFATFKGFADAINVDNTKQNDKDLLQKALNTTAIPVMMLGKPRIPTTKTNQTKVDTTSIDARMAGKK